MQTDNEHHEVLSENEQTLREEVRRKGGIASVPRKRLVKAAGHERWRQNIPGGRGKFSDSLREALVAADLGVLPIGRERETITGRVAFQHPDGLFAELNPLKKPFDVVAVFDKSTVLGAILMLAGNPGEVDCQILCAALESRFALGDDATPAGISSAIKAHGGLVILRQEALLATIGGALTSEDLLRGLSETGLVPLPICAFVASEVMPDAQVVLAMPPVALIGVTARDSPAWWLIVATACLGERSHAAAILASRGKELLDSAGLGPRFAEPWKEAGSL